jgi:hypothetical protein
VSQCCPPTPRIALFKGCRTTQGGNHLLQYIVHRRSCREQLRHCRTNIHQQARLHRHAFETVLPLTCQALSSSVSWYWTRHLSKFSDRLGGVQGLFWNLHCFRDILQAPGRSICKMLAQEPCKRFHVRH